MREWEGAEKVADYRSRADTIPHRDEGEAVLVELLPERVERFGPDSSVQVRSHDLAQPLPELGSFDLVVSSFAIHHLEDERKRALYGEVFALLEPGGLFCNLEHVASASEALHQEFLDLLGVPEDASNLLVDVETQLSWLRELGYEDADCLWRWRELALLFGRRGRR